MNSTWPTFEICHLEPPFNRWQLVLRSGLIQNQYTSFIIIQNITQNCYYVMCKICISHWRTMVTGHQSSKKKPVKNCLVLWHLRLIQPSFSVSTVICQKRSLSHCQQQILHHGLRDATQARLEMQHALELQRVKPMLILTSWTHVPLRENMNHDIISIYI